ncbi:MAG TPA: sigma-54 dependent transcriptional regulator [Candidatus Binatia bacterium]|nr:sigma-54 dependent transcriptional regulator [Candidatus Binatia bacterium]
MKTLSGTILVADDDPDIRDILSDTLNSLGGRVVTASDGQECLDKVENEGPELVLLDIEMPVKNGLKVLKELRQKGRDTTAIMITAFGTIDRAVQAMKEGAFDFITKPFDLDHIAIVVEKAFEHQSLKRGLERFSEEADERYRLIGGESPKMKLVINTARKAAASKSTVLLLGESGTGKEVSARAIHNWSERRQEPFIAINCVGLSKDLLESELFGHEKGAFTGAHQLKKGKMELADGGTVFLDEVGDISAELQTKLLRFLQEREFERVGGNQPIQVDVRVIAATSRDLSSAIKEGRFREDLYYRLNVIPISLPPLRERKEDIPGLAKYFSRRFALETKKNFAGITAEAEAKLVAYTWPGNVRELANVIERAAVLGHEPEITLEDLPSRISSTELENTVEGLSYRRAVDVARTDIIKKALAHTNGNRAAAARVLGLHKTHLLNLMKSLGIE